MKKCFVLLLSVVLLLSACSSGPARSEIRTFREFEEKWKLEDIENVLKNPAAFLADFGQLRRKDDDDKFLVAFDFSEWTDESLKATMNAASGSHQYLKNCTLLGMPVELNVYEPPIEDGALRTVILTCESGDFADVYNFAKSVALYLLGQAGDKAKAEIDDTETDAASLRKFLKDDKDISEYADQLDEGFSFSASSRNVGSISFSLYKRSISKSVHAYCSLFWY